MGKYIRKRLLRWIVTLLGVTLLLFLLLEGTQAPANCLLAKPVIYLYPEEEMPISVTLELSGTLTSSYPAYDSGWQMIAQPDGTLTDSTGREYYCLYWEGNSETAFDLSQGFVVPGSETAPFLEKSLSRLGLTQREANEFIIYWLPQMEASPYNLITFQTQCYEDAAKLHITPMPDSVIRIFMVWQRLDTPICITPQELTAPTRTGFTVVEWGGAELS